MTSENNGTVAPFSNELPQSESTLFKSDRLNCIEPPKPPKPPHNTSVGSGFVIMIVLVIVYAIIRYERMVVKTEQQNTQTKDQYE